MTDEPTEHDLTETKATMAGLWSRRCHLPPAEAVEHVGDAGSQTSGGVWPPSKQPSPCRVAPGFTFFTGADPAILMEMSNDR